MPPTSTDTGSGRRRPTGRVAAALLAVAAPAATVGDLLAGLGITLDGDDEVTPPLAAPPAATVTVVRVDVRQVTEERAVPVPKELRDDLTLARGATRVEADGTPGLERV